MPELASRDLFRLQTSFVPVAAQQAFPREEPADVQLVEPFSLTRIVTHDVQQRAQWRTRVVDAAVVEVMRRDALLGGDDVIHAVREDIEVLQFGAEHFVREHDVRMIKEAPEERANKSLCDAIPETAGEHLRSKVIEVRAAFEEGFGDEEFRIAFLNAHAAPEFRDQQTDVCIEAAMRADGTGGGE